MWSAGVCLYAMIVGSVPFKAGTMAALYELILNAKYDFEFQAGSQKRVAASGKRMADLFSAEVKDLIAKLLTLDPERRLTATSALAHPWLQDAPDSLDVFTEKEKDLVLRDYRRLNPQIKKDEEVLITEYNLETAGNEDEPEDQRNIMDKSYVLAPFNSFVCLNDTLEEEPETVGGVIRFGKKVREVNRKYEENNNADLDNGVINQAVQEQD